jgi:hypothetical protein
VYFSEVVVEVAVGRSCCVQPTVDKFHLGGRAKRLP